MHDIWVNWFEGEENGYNVYEFEAWRKDDKVVLLDQVPLLLVTPELFDYIENNLSDIPQNLLDAVKNKAYLRKNHERVNLPYAFIVTDGCGVLAVETLSYTIPYRKSRLIPRQFRLALEMIVDRDVDFEFPKNLEKEEKDYHMLSPHPNLMIGLTRREKQLKQLLFMGLDSLINEENLAKLKYVYSEWNIENYTNVKDLDLDELFKQFVKEVSKGWSNRHHELTKLIVHNDPFYNKLYEIEMA
jgi:hypothetical protein